MILAAMTGVLATPAAGADALQQQVVEWARSVPVDGYAFRVTTVAERTGGDRQTRVETYDPRRPAAERWTLVSVDGKPPSAKAVAAAGKAKRGPTPSYHKVSEWFGGPATRVASGAGTVTYRFARLPAGTIKIGSHDASADTAAEAVVNIAGKLPYVERVRMLSTTAFRMMLVAKLQRFESITRYRLAADGRPVVADFTSDIAGSMMGKAGTIRATVTFADFAAR